MCEVKDTKGNCIFRRQHIYPILFYHEDVNVNMRFVHNYENLGIFVVLIPPVVVLVVLKGVKMGIVGRGLGVKKKVIVENLP